ncbi:hypothetical protein B8W95_13145, partial [Staphylococcus pasteuri]
MAHANESTDSADEIPPLAFDSEEELRAVLDRLRGDLEGRVEQQAAGVASKGKGKGKGKAVLELGAGGGLPGLVAALEG